MMSLTSIPVNFKEVFTTHVVSLHINPYWTVTQLLETVRPILAERFNCEEFDIVPTGQDSPGIPAEAGLPLAEANVAIRQLWGQDLHISFYVRRLNYEYPQLQNLNNNRHANQDINPIITNSFVQAECPICFENVNTFTRHNCRHGTCNNCHYRCIQANIIGCPVCRTL